MTQPNASSQFSNDSPEYAAVVRLAQLGGKADVGQLMPAMWSGFRSVTRFDKRVGEPLIRAGLVVRHANGNYCLTDAGRVFARSHAVEVTLPIEQRRGNGSKVAALMRQAGTLRPGALDYRNHPSLMGGKQVPFHAIRDADNKGDE